MSNTNEFFGRNSESKSGSRKAIEVRDRFFGKTLYASTSACSVDEAVVKGIPLIEADLSHLDLSMRYLANGVFIRANFTGTKMHHAYAVHADFTDAVITEEQLDSLMTW